jgi:DUF2075 family protein/nucleoside-triphosphatase THEP1
MIVYEATVSEFVQEVLHDTITDNVYAKYKEHFGRSSEGQIRSWRNSLEYMYKVLMTPTIPSDAGVAIEFNIPMTAKRIDFMISGFDEDNMKSAVIVELKQWDECTKVEDKDGVVITRLNGAERQTTHPSYQAYSYKESLINFSEPVQQDPINLHPCAYLHNYKIEKHPDVIDNQYKYYLEKAPVFASGDVEKLRGFIRKYVCRGDKGALLYEISDGKVRPSKMLQDTLASMLDGNEEFIMIDDQKLVYEEALSLASDVQNTSDKKVMIVSGGPGTGKTVISINLLVELTKRGMLAQYTTKNSAPREVYFAKLKGRRHEMSPKLLFKSSGSYVEAGNNEMDVIIADEAHRLNAKSGMFQNKGENQIKEIIHASRLSVFFIDESQRVTTSDIGSEDEIRKFAEEQNAEIIEMKLESQFRCNGSDGYLAWLDHILGIRETANTTFDFDYDFRIFDDPNELRNAIVERNSNNKSRMVAGYCWNWITKGKNDPNVYDINIDSYNFHMTWNLANTTTWSIDPDSIDQCGCIHTCQGLEFDYVGVIIGDDLRYENGHLITDASKRAHTDKSLKGLGKMSKENPEEAERIADEIIRNTYRTLMTRGMKGCYIYCTDKNLTEYIKNRMHI